MLEMMDKPTTKSSTLNKEKYKNLILYLSHKCASKDNFGKTLLCKLLYFCDFDHYELYEESITGEKYIKLEQGPFPRKLDNLLKELEKEGKIKIIKTQFYNQVQSKSIALKEADLKVFSGDELKIIDNILQRFASYNADKVSDISHQDMPWKATEPKDVIDYELVFYRTPEFRQLVANE